MRKSTENLYLDPYELYKDFIEICRVKNYTDSCITQSHHIIPKALGGTDDKSNLVRLSVEDHMLAHELFAKTFDKGSYEEFVNLSAINLLNKGIKTKEQLEQHRQLYLGENNPFYDKTHTPETRARLSKTTTETRTGVTYEEFYKTEERALSERLKRSKSLEAYHKNLSEDQIKIRSEKISNSLKNKKLKAHNSLPIEINGVKYESLNDASRKTGISLHYIRKMKNENP